MSAVVRGVVIGALVAVGAVALPGAVAAQGDVEVGAVAALSRAIAESREAVGRMRLEGFRTASALAGLRSELVGLRAAPGMARLRSGLAGAGAASEVRAAVAERARAPVHVPEPWLRQDPADSLYRAARAALNAARYDRAASLFGEIREKHPRSGYVSDSYYFQALALQRAGGTRRLRRALELVRLQERNHSGTGTAEDARALAVRIEGALARSGDSESAALIQERAAAGCDAEDQELRSTALSALLHMDADRAVPLLREVLRSRDECSAELRKRAIFLVSQKMTPETVDLLLDLAHRNPDPDPEVREAAIFWLSQVQSDEALEALGAILEESDDPEIQERAVFAISQQRTERAGALLRSYAERSDASVELREQAIFWIGQRSGDRDRGYLRQLYGRVRETELKEKVIFGVATNPGEEDRRWLLALARNGSEPIELRKNALFWAGQTGEVEVSDLRGLYDDMDAPEMREQVIFVLSQDGDRESVTALMEIAREEDDRHLRERAIFWLGQSDDPRVADFLLELVRGGGG